MSYDPDDLERYYPYIQQETFNTIFFDLTKDQGQAIVDAYSILKHTKHDSIDQVLPDDILCHLKIVSDKIDAHLDVIGRPAFIRLSTRSPKDYALKTEKTFGILEAELEGISSEDEVSQVIALIRVMSFALQLDSGEETINSFVHSERVYQDIFVRLLNSHTDDDFNMKVIIREWVHILPEYEFRGFVYQGKLNALSQYYKACYVPEMVEKENLILQDILEVFERSKDFIDMNNYVIDFAYTEDKTYIVELNTFGKTASSALFDWKMDHDIMHNTDPDMELDFRIVRTPYPNCKGMIAKNLRSMIAQIFPEWGYFDDAYTPEMLEVLS
eukprot:TRINITY_DN3541_c0_g1_i1.p1 TRINITY_DN3541_c0_g1~~TRINITY_DN3541_c0_g1_i1.p1  ORF type:complete len:328 (+),score=59.17 TRINITY_DN3541_c0_g1_i1:12-995(+)